MSNVCTAVISYLKKKKLIWDHVNNFYVITKYTLEVTHLVKDTWAHISLRKQTKRLATTALKLLSTVTHVVLCRWCHCDHHMTLCNPFPWRCFLGHRDGHSQVSGPRPQYRWIWDGHIDVVAVLRKVRLPDGLNRREKLLSRLRKPLDHRDVKSRWVVIQLSFTYYSKALQRHLFTGNASLCGDSLLTLSTTLPVTPMPLRIVTLTMVGIPP